MFDRRVAHHHRHRCDYLVQPAQVRSVFQGKGTHVADQGPGKTEGVGLARGHADQMGAELGKFGQHKTMKPLSQGGQQHHGGDAHSYPQSRQDAAQALTCHGLQGKSDGVVRMHG